jgi:hypothetical protein
MPGLTRPIRTRVKRASPDFPGPTSEDGDRRASSWATSRSTKRPARSTSRRSPRARKRPHRSGAAEHLHQFGRQYRAARNRGRADRIPGPGVPVRQRILAAGAAGGGAALLPEPIVQTVNFTAGGQGWGQVTDPVPDRDRISPLVLDPRKQPPVIRSPSPCTCRPASRSRR